MESLKKEYCDLLNARESVSALDRALSLEERVLGTTLSDIATWLLTPGGDRPEGSSSLFLDVPESDAHLYVPSEYQQAAERERRARDKRRSQLRLVKTLLGLGVVPRIAADKEPDIPEDQYSLLMDTCLLVFHHAYFAFLPELSTKEWEVERRALLDAFWRFGHSLTRASDRYHVHALFFEAIGDITKAAHGYQQALSATHVDEHEFMTQLQLYWTFLIERRAFSEALDLIVSAYPVVPRKDLGEAGELIKDTFARFAQAKE